MAAMLFALSPLLVALYHAGQFTAEDIATVSQILSYWALCLPLYAGYLFLYFVFSSLRKLKVVSGVNIVFSLLQIALYAYLTKYIGGTGLGLIGIPLADTIFFGLMFISLFFLLRRQIGNFGGKEILGVLLRVSVAAVVGGAIALEFCSLLGTATTITDALGESLVAGGIGLTVTYGLCALMRVPEMQLIKNLGSKIARRLRGRSR
jgi:putative peptidoglycan lipid II flippase